MPSSISNFSIYCIVYIIKFVTLGIPEIDTKYYIPNTSHIIAGVYFNSCVMYGA